MLVPGGSPGGRVGWGLTLFIVYRTRIMSEVGSVVSDDRSVVGWWSVVYGAS